MLPTQRVVERMRWIGVLGLIALLTLAGCIAPAAVPPVPAATLEEPAADAIATAAEEIAPVELPETLLVTGDADQTAHARVASAHGGWSGAADLNLPRARPTNATLTVSWRSTLPLDSAMEVWFYDAGGREIATAYGPSPLVMPIDGAAFGDGTRFWGWPEPSGPAGVALGTTVHFELSVTYA